MIAFILWGCRANIAQEGPIGPLPLSARGQPVVGFPEGAPAIAPVPPVFTTEELTRLRNGNYRAAISMQALDSPWNSLQVQGISETLGKYGVELVAVTDAAQDPGRQAAQLRALADQKIQVLFSVPIDPATQTLAYRRVSEAGIKLILMDNVPHGLQPGKDYVTVVGSDNEQNAVFATEELLKAIGGRGEVALITYSYESYYSIAARRRGFEQTLAGHPDVRLAAVVKFTQPSEVYQKTIAMLTAHPNIKGIFAVWSDPAMQAIAGAQAVGREDIVVTTNDLGPDSALYVARGQIKAIGAQLPYDLGVAEANAALYALLGKPVAPYISIAALGVRQSNLLSALEMVTKRSPPPEISAACGDKCKAETGR
ncbi:MULTISPECIES: substrate-binding domain-containing protein [unclassified Bradyrhizobium]|uniref:substrate-binding domain-containing protein n=1 Tax=unclassified Bradyrhizobium TaxID=2631580 RepID=UPI001314A657|nr:MULTISPECIES: substrate-binding domain-containing protein [unclassified Bradyrhizobium]